MKRVIEACLWFWALLFCLASQIAGFVVYPKTEMVFTGLSLLVFSTIIVLSIQDCFRVKNKKKP